MHQDFQRQKAECLRQSMDPTYSIRVFYFPTEKDMWTGPVPVVIDVLVTYMLPLFHRDIADFGDENLLEEMGRRRSRVHVLGHVHEGYGKGYFVYDCFEACYEDICRGIPSLSILIEIMFCPSLNFLGAREL